MNTRIKDEMKQKAQLSVTRSVVRSCQIQFWAHDPDDLLAIKLD